MVLIVLADMRVNWDCFENPNIEFTRFLRSQSKHERQFQKNCMGNELDSDQRATTVCAFEKDPRTCTRHKVTFTAIEVSMLTILSSTAPNDISMGSAGCFNAQKVSQNAMHCETSRREICSAGSYIGSPYPVGTLPLNSALAISTPSSNRAVRFGSGYANGWSGRANQREPASVATGALR
jgi:hypothetical protein